jgi:hypothetical protein
VLHIAAINLCGWQTFPLDVVEHFAFAAGSHETEVPGRAGQVLGAMFTNGEAAACLTPAADPRNRHPLEPTQLIGRPNADFWLERLSLKCQHQIKGQLTFI